MARQVVSRIVLLSILEERIGASLNPIFKDFSEWTRGLPEPTASETKQELLEIAEEAVRLSFGKQRERLHLAFSRMSLEKQEVVHRKGDAPE